MNGLLTTTQGRPLLGRLSGGASTPTLTRGLWTSLDSILSGFVKAISSLPSSNWFLFDLAVIGIGVQVAYTAYQPVSPPETPHVAPWQCATVFAFTVLLSGLVLGLYERETCLSRSRIVVRVLMVTALSVVLSYSLIYVVMYATVSRRIAGITLGTYAALAVSLRLAACHAVSRLQRGLVVVGPAASFDLLRAAQAEGFLCEYKLLGYVDSGEPSAESQDGLIACNTTSGRKETDPFHLGRVQDLIGRLADLNVTDIVVHGAGAHGPRAMSWIAHCLQAGCRVTNEVTFYESATGQILVDRLCPNWFLFADLKHHCEAHATAKRVFDIIVGMTGLLAALPICLLIGLAILLLDGRPVIYTQERVGQHGKVFRLFKFRTMRRDAENGKSVWCTPHDPRVTPLGRILRRTRLDELPQFINVIIGHMSVVGPRPERPDIVQELMEKIPYYFERHLVKPGITGWAQISFRYGASIEDARRKLRFDLFYLKNMCLELDFMILLRTVGTFLRGAC